MCGFLGFLGGVPACTESDSHALLKRMSDKIVHRGPDDAGYWSYAKQAIGLGFRRLAIVDLSPAGHQPMHSDNEQYVLVFNGEIYNHLSLRTELEKYARINWRGHSDTETLLAGFSVWGIQETIERAIGMFAIAVWDKQSNILTLARDRVGEKPLYYGWQGSEGKAAFLFGSELKALKVHPNFNNMINRDALASYIRHGYIGGDLSIYQGVKKLLPGHILTISLTKPEPVLKQYWSAANVAVNGAVNGAQKVAATRKNNTFFNADESIKNLDTLLKNAVSQQMMADVPLGAFLSGGIDSSTIVALMQAQSNKPIQTFTIGFDEVGYNEAVHAKAVAKHLGTQHTELYITSQQAMDVIPKLPQMYDEPFADSSQIPTHLVSALARQHVTVSLSGDAGDELFCGYNRYQLTDRFWGKLKSVPRSVRVAVASVIRSINPDTWNTLANVVPNKKWANVGDKLHKGAGVMGSQTLSDLYLAMVSQWQDPNSIVIGATEPPSVLTGLMPELSGLNDIERMMALDLLSYLPEDILTKVDRAAMAISLETRVPFLDHRVVEFAWQLPMEYKLREGNTKWILREVLYKYVPKTLMERPKMGFGIPLHDWLRGPLRGWAEELIDEKRLQKEGYFYAAPIRTMWKDHLCGKRNWAHHLWTILMFQVWLAEQTKK
jgi:asparagine synthase (glutamine-hydrolysing)